MNGAMHALSPDTFQRDGYLIVRGLAGREDVGAMRKGRAARARSVAGAGGVRDGHGLSGLPREP